MAIRLSQRRDSAKSSYTSDADLKARIARKAYELFEKRGRKNGNDLDDWFRAEREVRRELA